jgi:hypothetical protein
MWSVQLVMHVVGFGTAALRSALPRAVAAQSAVLPLMLASCMPQAQLLVSAAAVGGAASCVAGLCFPTGCEGGCLAWLCL